MKSLDELTHAQAAWAGLKVVVTGLGVSGFACADALLDVGAQVSIVDNAVRESGSALDERAHILDVLGATVTCQPGAADALPAGEWDVVVTSPGWPPTQPLLAQAAAAGIPIWGDVELAWRMRPEANPAPWLAVTGTNGKTTTVQMLTSILTAAGLRACSVGNVGTPVIEAIRHPDPFDVLAVELSSFQLHWSDSIAAQAAAVLNIAPDHLDWHGSPEAYAADKGKIYARTEIACVYNEDDQATMALVEEAEVQEGCRAIGFTLGIPAPSMVGLVDDVLADRAFVEQRRYNAAPLCQVSEIAQGQIASAPQVTANALAAAALARAHGVSPDAVKLGLQRWRPEPHRLSVVEVVDEVTYVDDSKATNPHAAASALRAFESVVWIGGGLLKGAHVDELVMEYAPRMRAAILIGADREAIAQAFARHAPEIPVIEVATTDTDAMDVVVRHARSLAQPGDTVLLAPAAASMDMFANYSARGDAFARAVAQLDRS